jgi:hypothetical protein
MQVAFLPFTAGAVVVQMEYKAVENMDRIYFSTGSLTNLFIDI